jgi:hypothetical protein
MLCFTDSSLLSGNGLWEEGGRTIEMAVVKPFLHLNMQQTILHC